MCKTLTNVFNFIGILLLKCTYKMCKRAVNIFDLIRILLLLKSITKSIYFLSYWYSFSAEKWY